MTWLKDTYHIENLEEVDTPALAVYPDRVAENIRQALAMLNTEAGTVLRPHVKTIKTPEIVRMLLDAGISRFKCSTIAEAEMLGREGAADVLLAHQPTHLKAKRLAQLRQAFSDTVFSCLVDNQLTASVLAELFIDHPLPVFIDLDVGMHRTGLAPDVALGLYAACYALPGLRVVGLHAYDGHIRSSDITQRRAEADATYAQAYGVQQAIKERYKVELTLVMGGSPTFPCHARRAGLECSPGTFSLWDAGYSEAFPDIPFTPAALLLTRVISVVDEYRLCLDVGSKAVAADAAWPRIVFPDQPEAEALKQSEEHLVVRVADPALHRVGDVWWGIPIHICPTVNLYETLLVIRGGRWVEEWEVTARRRKITI